MKMSVRQSKRIDPKTGKVTKVFDVDVSYTNPDGKRRRERQRLVDVSKRYAEQYERKMMTALLDGTYGRKEREIPTLEAFSDEFQKSYVKVHNKPSEQRNKEMHLRVHLVPAFGRKKLDEITALDIDRYTAKKLRTGLNPKTINLHLSTLRRALVLAYEWDLIAALPRIRRMKETKPEFVFLDFEEAERLVAAADPEWRVMIITGLKTGMRLGELLGLQWNDVDLVAGRVIVRRNLVRGILGTPKSGKNREIPLSDDAITALKSHRHLKGDVVFCTESGDYLTKEITKRPLWRACKRAGIPHKIGWHALMHTFASHLAMRGSPAKAILELLGHSSIEMTNRYMHLTPDARREAVQLLDKLSGSNVNSASTRDTKECN